MAAKNKLKEDKKRAGEPRSPSPEPSHVPRATGLPDIGPNDRLLLRGNAQWLIRASGSEVSGYCLRRHGDDVEGQLLWHVKLDGTVTALAESRYGVVIACSREENSALLRLLEGHVYPVASIQGRVSSIACLGASAFAVVSQSQRLDARLVEVDLYRNALGPEQPLSSAQIELTSDVTGTYLGLVDPLNRTFQVRNPKSEDPCDQDTTGGSAPPNQPLPGGVPSTGAGDGCCCRKTEPPHQTSAAPTPGAAGPAPGRTSGRTPQPCVPGDAGTPTPGGGSVVGKGGRVGQNPPGGGAPNPCSADLGWRTRMLAAAASSFVVADATGRNLAVLSAQDLRILDSRQFARAGAVALADPTSPMVLLYHRSNRTWEVLHTDTLAARLGALDRSPIADPASGGVTFTGMQIMDLITPHANATGTIKILLLAVLEAGQTFNDPDFAHFGAYLERTAFSHVRDFYFENSFGLLKDIRYQVYGLQAGPSGGPLHLPKLVKDYFYPPYDPARVELKKSPIIFPYTLVFDGRESLTLKVQGATNGRPPAAFTLKFPALILEDTQKFFPAQVHYAGSETATINVKLPSGTAKSLKLVFPAKNVVMNKQADVVAALADLANYLDGVFAAAESAAGISPRLFTKPQVRQIKQPGMDFGILAVVLNHTDFSGARLDITSVTASAGSDPLGFQSPLPGHITLDGSGIADSQLQSYLQSVQVMAEEDAGFDFTQRYLTDVGVLSSGGALLVKLAISDNDGGPGASVKLSSSTGLGALFDTATPVPNSDTNLFNTNGMRDFDKLINDAFTDAVSRQAPPGSDYKSLRDNINNFFNQFDSILIGQIGVAKNDPADPNTVQPGEMWTTSPSDHADRRAVDWWHTGYFAPYTDIQTQKPWNFVFLDTNPDVGTMCHELGHALGYRDLYSAPDFRQDLAYLDAWSVMADPGSLSHHASYHKVQSQWITPDRVITIPPTDPGKTTETEALLVPVEFWNDSLVKKAKAQFGASLPVVQIIELDLGGDNAVVDRIEARQTGVHFSQHLPKSPAIIITNALQPWDDKRYVSSDATSGEQAYRRELHLLNPDNILQNPGDAFDLAKAPALSAKGIVVTVLDRKEIDGISVFHVKVNRENTAYVDLYFTKGDPYYKSPDLWVDWAGDNGPGGGSSPNAADHHKYPPGQPTDQGEQVHVPDHGTELHWIVGRVRNKGQVEADEVKLNFQVCIPPGGGDRSKNFQSMNLVTVATVPGGDVPIDVPSKWDVPAGFGGHVCLLVDIADYTIPHDSDGSALASADVWPANNWAQKNVDQYVPVHNSPYEPIEFDFSVNNAGWRAETTYLEPQNLPYGMRLTVTPARRSVPPGATVLFRCRLELDDQIIDAGCRNDREFRIVAWRTEGDTAVPWGGVVYKIKPRKGSSTKLTGFWGADGIIQLNGSVSPDPTGGLAHIRLAFAGLAAEWQVAAIQPGGAFALTVKAPGTSADLDSIALYEGSTLLSPSRSAPLKISAPAAIK